MVGTLTRAAALAGLMLSAGLALAQDTPAPASNLLYCTGCLCDDTPPRMTMPGRWVPSGTMGTRTTMRWQPADPPRGDLALGRCRPPPRA